MNKKFGISIPEELVTKVEKIAADNKVSRNEIIRRAINAYVKEQENRK
jgi:metal-responsive CopG/Arc/MetJ family transcriptional regulator